MLTKEQINKYCTSPYYCPYCGNGDIEADYYNEEAGGRKITCHKCNREWWEVLKITSIEEI